MTDWKALFGPDYPKVNTIFERDDRGVIIPGRPATPEIAYLWDSLWHWDEKVDGTNIRLHWDGSRVYACGREVNAQVNARLLASLVRQDLLSPALWESAFPGASDMTVYGEGYGGDIQKAGKAYGNEPSLIVFDVNIGGWWLSRENVKDVAGKLGLPVVPLLFTTTIADAWEMTATGGYSSQWPGVRVEGLVGRPAVDLYAKRGERIMAKMKVRDQEDWLRAQEQPAGRKGKRGSVPGITGAESTMSASPAEATGRDERQPNAQSFSSALECAVRGDAAEGPGEKGTPLRAWAEPDAEEKEATP